MVGPAPKNVVREKRQASGGRETAFHAVDGGVSYDSSFVFGEVGAAWRGWTPLRNDWSYCDPAACRRKDLGDGWCDAACNTPGCDFDMGDCCEDQCNEPVTGVRIHRAYACGSNGYDCKDRAYGWRLAYNNRDHIGQRILTESVESAAAMQDITDTYKQRVFHR
jgi:hypothetical protein